MEQSDMCMQGVWSSKKTIRPSDHQIIRYEYHLKAIFKYFHMGMMASCPIAFSSNYTMWVLSDSTFQVLLHSSCHRDLQWYQLLVVYNIAQVLSDGIFCKDFTMKGCGRWGSDRLNVTCFHGNRVSLIVFLGWESCEMSKCKFYTLYHVFSCI